MLFDFIMIDSKQGPERNERRGARGSKRLWSLGVLAELDSLCRLWPARRPGHSLTKSIRLARLAHFTALHGPPTDGAFS